MKMIPNSEHSQIPISSLTIESASGVTSAWQQLDDYVGAGAFPSTRTVTKSGHDMAANELSAQLWRERELLDLLLFKLGVQHIVLTQGFSRWNAHAIREVEFVTKQLRTATLARDVNISAVAHEWDAPENSTLHELAENAPDEMWAEIITAHADALEDLSTEVDESRAIIARFLSSETHTAARTNGGDAATYNAVGGTNTAPPSARVIDQTF